MPAASTPARTYRGTLHNLARLASALHRGELVAVPTETVYGLAANALDPAACRAIFTAKGRPTTDPLIVHVHTWAQVEKLAVVNAAARLLARSFWPGPLTLVLPKQPIVNPIVTAGLSSVAVRMPSHPLLRRLLRRCSLPLAAPSANPFGYISPTTAAHVRASLGRRIRWILDGGPCAIGLESTIVDLRDPARPVLLRPGAISREQLSLCLGLPVALGASSAQGRSGAAQAQLAPGLLSRHYSPRIPVELHASIQPSDWQKVPHHEAWLLIAAPCKHPLPRNVFVLDRRGNLAAAARHLFARLREIDASGSFTRLHAELARGDHLADAINDRLRRAAAQG